MQVIKNKKASVNRSSKVIIGIGGLISFFNGRSQVIGFSVVDTVS